MSQPQDLYLQVPEEFRRSEFWHDDESGFTFLSTEEMAKNPFHNMVAVAKGYGGLGLWNLLLYVPEHSGWYVTVGGGSNAIDRQESMDFLREYKPSESQVFATWREAVNQS